MSIRGWPSNLLEYVQCRLSQHISNKAQVGLYNK